jgi:hypothetical protein
MLVAQRAFSLLDSIPVGAGINTVMDLVARSNSNTLRLLSMTWSDSLAAACSGIKQPFDCEAGSRPCSLLLVGFYEWGLFFDHMEEDVSGRTEYYHLGCRLNSAERAKALLEDGNRFLKSKTYGDYKPVGTLTFTNGVLVRKASHEPSWGLR